MRKYFSPFLSIAYCLLSIAIQAQQWHKLGNGIGCSSTCVKDMKVIGGDLYIGGAFGTSCNAPGNSIAKYNSTTEIWDSVGVGVAGEVYSIETYNGEMYVGGLIQGAGYWPFNLIPNTSGITKWNGSQWLSVDSVLSSIVGTWVRTLKYKNDLYVGGTFFNASTNYKCVARYNGSTVDNMLGGLEGFPLAAWNMAVYKNELIVAGEFVQVGNGAGYDMDYYNIAQWNGIKWDSLGSGVNGWVSALEVDTVNDILYVGGGFTMAGGTPVRYVAKWDGTQWSAVPPLPTISSVGVLKMYKGKLYAGLDAITGNPTDTLLMYLDDSGWHPVFGPNGGGGVYALEVYNGNLYVGGCFAKIDTTVVNEIACYGDSCPGTPITLTLPYGVQEFNVQSLKFKVYPNPAKKEITIELAVGSSPEYSGAGKEKYTVRVKNSLGQMMKEYQFKEKKFTVSTADYKKGLYLVEVCTAEGEVCHTEKIIIE